MEKTDHFGLDFATFARLIDNLHDEIIIYDNNYRIVYVNRACERHYGFAQEEMIGQSFWDFTQEDQCWTLSVLPTVYDLKRPLKQEQETYLGANIFTIAMPLKDDSGDVEYVLMSVRDEFHEESIQRFTEIVDAKENPPERLQGGIIYRSQLMEHVIKLAHQVARTPSACLLLGESGCGKSLLAKYIHANGPRAEKPFVVVNCASIPHDLFESELFGHMRGAFTGAVSNKEGLFKKAEGGTLFLDEISELPPQTQAKLLHAVQEMEYRPVGGTQDIKADVRIIAATNRNLLRMADHGAFRLDLYYRLNVVEITVPPLRKRVEDLNPLVNYFLNYYGKRYGTGKRLSKEAFALLRHYSWPGNVRELAHLLERLVVTVDAEIVTVDHLPASLYETASRSPSYEATLPDDIPLDDALLALERKMVQRAYQQHGSSRKVAKALGLSQTKASRLIRKHIEE